MRDREHRPLPLGLVQFPARRRVRTNWPPLMAAVVMATIPIVVYLLPALLRPGRGCERRQGMSVTADAARRRPSGPALSRRDPGALSHPGAARRRQRRVGRHRFRGLAGRAWLAPPIALALAILLGFAGRGGGCRRPAGPWRGSATPLSGHALRLRPLRCPTVPILGALAILERRHCFLSIFGWPWSVATRWAWRSRPLPRGASSRRFWRGRSGHSCSTRPGWWPVRERLRLAALLLLAYPRKLGGLGLTLFVVVAISTIAFVALLTFAVALSALVAARFVLPAADRLEGRLAGREVAVPVGPTVSPDRS